MDRLGGYGVGVLAFAWIISAPLGMIYWAAKGWLLGVVLPLILPGFGLLSTLAQIMS